jgi:hypothetical protein
MNFPSRLITKTLMPDCFVNRPSVRRRSLSRRTSTSTVPANFPSRKNGVTYVTISTLPAPSSKKGSVQNGFPVWRGTRYHSHLRSR